MMAYPGIGNYPMRQQQPNMMGEEKELATKSLNIQNKRFYVDVKQNNRGRFIKIAEQLNQYGARKSRILLSMATAAELRDKLTELSEIYSKLGPHQAEGGNPAPPQQQKGGPQHGQQSEVRIRSETIMRENRRYYLDLKENARGRFLRITMLNSVSRAHIAVPAQGMIEVRNALQEFVQEFGKGEELRNNMVQSLPDSHSLRDGNKMFYFDVGSNQRGVFLRVSEVRPTFRTAITVPDRSWERFREIVNEYADRLKDLKVSEKEAGLNNNDKSGTDEEGKAAGADGDKSKSKPKQEKNINGTKE